jgi:hypothetical protein
MKRAARPVQSQVSSESAEAAPLQRETQIKVRVRMPSESPTNMRMRVNIGNIVVIMVEDMVMKIMVEDMVMKIMVVMKIMSGTVVIISMVGDMVVGRQRPGGKHQRPGGAGRSHGTNRECLGGVSMTMTGSKGTGTLPICRRLRPL